MLRQLSRPRAASLPLRVRESRRARRLTLRLLPPYTLELVVPRGTRAADVAAFVHAHRRWIERARREIAARYPLARGRLPTRIELPAIDQQLARALRQPPHRPARAAVLRRRLGCRDARADRRGADALLRDWLLEQARVII